MRPLVKTITMDQNITVSDGTNIILVFLIAFYKNQVYLAYKVFFFDSDYFYEILSEYILNLNENIFRPNVLLNW